MKGGITIFFGMILTLILSLALTLIEGARYSAQRLAITSVYDTAANSVLASYHRQLFERYGLLFTTETKVEEQMAEVFRRNFEKDTVGHLLGVRDLLAIGLQDVKLEKMTLATDDGGKVIQRQCVACMEEKYAVTYLEKIMDLLGMVESQNLLEEDRTICYGDGEMTETELREELAKVSDAQTRIPDVFHWVEKEALAFLLGQREYSEQRLPLEDRVSERGIVPGAGLDEELEFESNQWTKFLFIEYLLDYTGNYVMPREAGFLTYQTEYLLNGKEIDGDNLWETGKSLLEIRTGANMVGILADENRSAVLKELSVSLASSVGNPELEALFFSALLVIWAEVEGIYDVRLLLKGEGVGLIKAPEEWLLDVSWITKVVQASAEEYEWILQQESQVYTNEAEQTKLNYEDYLRILLWFQDEEIVLSRFLDIVESDIKSITGQSDFRLENYGDRFWVQSNLKSSYGREYIISRKYGY